MMFSSPNPTSNETDNETQEEERSYTPHPAEGGGGEATPSEIDPWSV